MNLLVIVKNINYTPAVIRLIKKKQEEMGKSMEKVLYISLDTSYSTLLAAFSREGFKMDSLIVIDTKTKKEITEPEFYTNCIYVPPDTELSEVPKLVDLLFKKCTFCGVVLDSLSLFAKRNGDNDVVNFAEELLSEAKKYGCCCMFICEESDLGIAWAERLKKHFDETVEL